MARTTKIGGNLTLDGLLGLIARPEEQQNILEQLQKTIERQKGELEKVDVAKKALGEERKSFEKDVSKQITSLSEQRTTLDLQTKALKSEQDEFLLAKQEFGKRVEQFELELLEKEKILGKNEENARKILEKEAELTKLAEELAIRETANEVERGRLKLLAEVLGEREKDFLSLDGIIRKTIPQQSAGDETGDLT